MKNFKKITSLVLAICMAISVFSVSAFATGVKDSVSLAGKVTPASKTLDVKFAIPEGLSDITGIQFSIDFPTGFSVNSIDTALKDSGWQIKSNFPDSKVVVLHSTNLSKLEDVATAAAGAYTIATVTLDVESNVVYNTYNANAVVMDITSGADHHSNINTETQQLSFVYENAQAHTHTFDQKVANSTFLKTPATCTSKAVYHMSCTCGEKGTATFEYGSVNPAKHTGGTVIKNKKAATYTAYGYTGDVCCKSCGAIITKGKSTEMIPRISMSKTTVSSMKSKTYTGKSLTQSITVKYGKKYLVNGKDYLVKYYYNKKPGKATVKITGYGAYTGTVYKYFYIYPKKATLSSVKPYSKKALKATWKKDSTVTGYQIKYAKNSKFKSSKTVTVKTYKTYKKTIKKLSSKKYYYVKVRSYKTVGKTKLYGSYSKVKKVKVK